MNAPPVCSDAANTPSQISLCSSNIPFQLYTMDGVPLYRWDGESAVPRTAEEIEAERAAMPEPPPTAQEQLRADVDFLAALQGVSL